ncbi:MAG: hypothetical protein R2705_06900 [Ilumatobacteraceae bacterium]
MSAQPSDDFSFVFGVISAVVVGGTSIAGGEGAVWRTVAGAFFARADDERLQPSPGRSDLAAHHPGLCVILAAVGIDTWNAPAGMSPFGDVA